MRCAVFVLAACTSANGAPPPPAPAGDAAIAAPIMRVGDPRAPGRVIAARIAVAIGSAAASDRPAYARRDQAVRLFAVLDVQDAGGVTIYSDAPALRLAGHAVTPRPIATAPQVELRWNKLEPAQVNLSNGEPATFHYAEIDYRATPHAAGPAAIPADVHPTLTADHGDGVGTMRYQLVALQGERVIASPGPEARRGGASGGLRDTVARVAIRRDDSYLGYLTELYNQPYIWASAGTTDASHQSERLEGADCADFIVYGARRMGAKLAYTYTGGLPRVTRLLAAGTRGRDGVYRDARGQPIAFTRPGDIVLFPRHVGALAADRGTPGVLDDQDLVMHTLFDSPKEQALAATGYADQPLELRRFTADLRPGR